MWYHHNHPHKTVRNWQSHYLSHILPTSITHCFPPVPRPQDVPNVLRRLSGNMTNNPFSSPHTHSKTVTVTSLLPRVLDKLLPLIAGNPQGCSHAIQILAAAAKQGRRLFCSALLEVRLLFEALINGGVCSRMCDLHGLPCSV